MPADAIVISLDITERFTAGFLHIFKYPAFYQFGFEPPKETFRLRVVLAIAFSAPGLPQGVSPQQLAGTIRHILTAPVGMDDRLFPDQPTP